MKKLTLILLLMFPMAMYSQSNLVIRSTKGDVRLKRADKNDFQSIKALDEVHLDDVVSICKECSLSITNTANGNRYNDLNKVGKWTIRQLLEEREKHESKLFSNRWSKMCVSHDVNGSIPIIGGKRRGADSIDIYDTIYAMLLQDGQEIENFLDISVQRTDNYDGSFSIAIKNTSTKVLFCNVLIKSEQWVPAVCYHTEPFINMIPLIPNVEIDFADMPLDAKAGEYYLLITEDNISIRHLGSILKDNPKLEKCSSEKIKMIRL